MMEFRRKLLPLLFVGACGVAILVAVQPQEAMTPSETPEEPAVILVEVPGMNPIMWDVDLPGFDFATYNLNVPEPGQCEYLCAQNPQCRAWTYVKPYTIQGPVPRCWLKAGVPRAQHNTCCVSGTKQLRR